jgi:hypothetical protein
MKKIEDNPDLIRNLGKKSRKTIENLGLDINTYLSKLEEIYKEVLLNKK